MKRLGKQTKEITLKRIESDGFQFTIKAGYYYIDNKEVGVIIETGGAIVLFDSQEEYNGNMMGEEFWEDIFSKWDHVPFNDQESMVLDSVVGELLRETNTGVNQLYIDDETWIDGYFELVI